MKKPKVPTTPDGASLLDAAKAGNLAEIERLLGQGVPVDSRDTRSAPWDVTALMYSARHGHHVVVRRLLDAGASTKARDADFPGEGGGWTALHYAARGGSLECVQELVKAGANVNALSKSADGTPLEAAIPILPKRFAPGPGLKLVDNTPSPEQQQRTLHVVQYLLSAKADPNLPNKSNGGTPLHTACSIGNVKLVECLLANGANPNFADDLGWTAFERAAAKKKVDAALLLLNAGLDLRHKDNKGATHLMWAIWGREPRLVAELIARGAPVNEVNNNGQSALDIANEVGDPEIVKLLAKADASSGRKTPNKK